MDKDTLITIITIATIVLSLSPFIINIFLIGFSKISTSKRKILLVIDYVLLTLLFLLLIVPFFIVYKLIILIVPSFILYIVVYDLILFKVFKRYMLTRKLEEIDEDVNDAIIDSLVQLEKLDHKAAFNILKNGLKKHPGEPRLMKLLNSFEQAMKQRERENSEVLVKE